MTELFSGIVSTFNREDPLDAVLRSPARRGYATVVLHLRNSDVDHTALSENEHRLGKIGAG